MRRPQGSSFEPQAGGSPPFVLALGDRRSRLPEASRGAWRLGITFPSRDSNPGVVRPLAAPAPPKLRGVEVVPPGRRGSRRPEAPRGDSPPAGAAGATRSRSRRGPPSSRRAGGKPQGGVPLAGATGGPRLRRPRRGGAPVNGGGTLGRRPDSILRPGGRRRLDFVHPMARGFTPSRAWPVYISSSSP